MKVLNEKLEPLEDGEPTLSEIVTKYKDKRIFVEIKGMSVILPQDSVILIAENKDLAKRRTPKKKERRIGENGELLDDEDPTVAEEDEVTLPDENAIDSVEVDEDSELSQSRKKIKKERRKSREVRSDRRRSHPYNLRDILTKKGTNRFRPMNEKTIEEILEQVLRHKEDVKEWTEFVELLRIVENLSYLLEKHRRSLSETASSKNEPITERQIRTMDRIELFIDEIWKVVESTPRQAEQSFDSTANLSTIDPKADASRKRRREEEDDFEYLSKKVAAIREKLPEKNILESSPGSPGVVEMETGDLKEKSVVDSKKKEGEEEGEGENEEDPMDIPQQPMPAYDSIQSQAASTIHLMHQQQYPGNFYNQMEQTHYQIGPGMDKVEEPN